MRTHLTYQIRSDRPGVDPVPLIPYVAERFASSIHEQVASAAAKTTTGTLSASIRSRSWLTYNFQLG